MSDYHKDKPYHKYTDKEKDHLWKEHHLQPCVYCGILTGNTTCGVCGYKEDKSLGKVD